MNTNTFNILDAMDVRVAVRTMDAHREKIENEKEQEIYKRSLNCLLDDINAFLMNRIRNGGADNVRYSRHFFYKSMPDNACCSVLDERSIKIAEHARDILAECGYKVSLYVFSKSWQYKSGDLVQFNFSWE